MIIITQRHWRKGAISFAVVTGLLASSWTTQAIAQDDDGLEEIIVTGSYIKRSQSDMASPVLIIGSSELADIGASTLPDMINTLTINSGAQIYANHLDQGRNAGTTNVNLRGLGEASTLVLLNSTRATLTPAVNRSGDQYVNLSTLVPMIAVERVEILKDGASALYGSDAVAGVVNFITRDTFEGLQFKAELANNEYGGDETHFGVIIGGKHERGNFMAAFEYMTSDPVTNAERFSDFEPTMNSITGYGAPAVNIADFGLDIRMPDPDCDAATAAYVDRQVFFDPNSNVCRMTYGYFGNVISEEERLQGYVSASYEITDNVEFFAEMGYANIEVIIGSVPTQPNTNPVYVTESHPDAIYYGAGPLARINDPLDPFAGAPVGSEGERELPWIGRIFGAGHEQNNDLKPFNNWRTRGGLRGAINDTWDYTLSYIYSSEETSAFRRESVLTVLQEALYGRGGPNGDEYYRFGYRNRDANSQDLLDPIIGFYGYTAEANQKVFDAVISGSFGSMGDSEIGVAFGVQWREDQLMYDYNDQSNDFVFSFFVGGDDFDVKQSATAAFAEFSFPISEEFEFNLAGRYESIEDESTFDPKVSFLYTPTDQWSVRGSWGTSFRVPSLFAQYGSYVDASSGTDPNTGVEITFTGERTGNPNKPLVPQESTSINIGTTYQGDNGFVASIDYWNFDYEGYITYEQPSSILTVDPNGPQVIRSPGGNVIKVIGYAANAGFVKTDGIDLGLSYAFETGVGTITPYVDATQILGYDVDDPSFGPLDVLGLANRHNVGHPAIETRANFGVRYNNEGHSANVIARYIGCYLSDETDGNLGGPIVFRHPWGDIIQPATLDPENFLPVDSQTTIDMQYSYTTESMFGGDTVSIFRIGARNITGELPPVFHSTPGYDEYVHDPRGRYFYGSISISF